MLMLCLEMATCPQLDGIRVHFETERPNAPNAFPA